MLFFSNRLKAIPCLENEPNNTILKKYIRKTKGWHGPGFLTSGGGVDGRYIYRYELLSKDDNIIYGVNYVKDKTDSFCQSTYKQVKELYEEKDNILNILKKYIDEEATTININPYYQTTNDMYNAYVFEYEYIINIEDKLDDIISEDYLNRIESFRKEVFNNNLNKYDTDELKEYRQYYFSTRKGEGSDNDYHIIITVKLCYKDNKCITLSYERGAIREVGEHMGGCEMYTYLKECMN